MFRPISERSVRFAGAPLIGPVACPPWSIILSLATTTGGSQTYDLTNATREDLLDIITMISPTDTPFFSSIDKGNADATLHEWLTDALPAPTAANSHIEGEDATYAVETARTRLTNFTQIFTNTISITTTQEAVVKAGIRSELAYQATKKMEAHKLDIEWAIFNNAAAGAAGDATTARLIKGIKAFISASTPDHQIPPTAGADLLIAQTDIDDALESIWNEGGKADVIMTSLKQKRRIASFTTGITKSLEMTQNEERRMINRIDVYEGDFGVVRLVPNRLIPTDTGTGGSTDCYFFEMAHWAFDFLTRPFVEPLAKTGDAHKRWVYSEGTLVGKALEAQFVYETCLNNLA
jgi:hypothetical protein